MLNTAHQKSSKETRKESTQRAHSKGEQIIHQPKIRSTADEMFFSSTLKMFAQILEMMSFAHSKETKMVCME